MPTVSREYALLLAAADASSHGDPTSDSDWELGEAQQRVSRRARVALLGTAGLLAVAAACWAAGQAGRGADQVDASKRLAAEVAGPSVPDIPPCATKETPCPRTLAGHSGAFFCPFLGLCREESLGPFGGCEGQCFTASRAVPATDEEPVAPVSVNVTPLAQGAVAADTTANLSAAHDSAGQTAAAAAAVGTAGASSAVPVCSSQVHSCPTDWLLGATGGYYCSEHGGCRKWSEGPFANCTSQCSIGKVPAISTIRVAAPLPANASHVHEASGVSSVTEGAQAVQTPWAAVTNDTNVSSGVASGIPACSDNVICPAEWKSGVSGGYYCSDVHGCQEWSLGPFTDCPTQCAIGNLPPTSSTTPRVTTTGTTTTTAQPWGSPSLLCFSVARCGGELDIIWRQSDLHAGIFACDMALVVTDGEVEVGGGVEVLTIPAISGGVSKDGTAANTEAFMHAWKAVEEHGQFTKLDWTVKVDPDAVLLPDRLRSHLSQHGGSVYVKNCNKYPGAPDWPMMFGSLEALTREAVEAYFAGADRCRDELPWQDWGEDLFLSHCLDMLGVGSVEDFNIIGDGRCEGVSCSDGSKPAFHPFKDTGSWEACWNEATR